MANFDQLQIFLGKNLMCVMFLCDEYIRKVARTVADLNIVCWEESEASMGFPDPPAFVDLKRSPCWDGRGQEGHEKEEDMTTEAPRWKKDQRR